MRSEATFGPQNLDALEWYCHALIRDPHWPSSNADVGLAVLDPSYAVPSAAFFFFFGALASALPPRRSDRKSGSADNRQPILKYCVRTCVF
jgi:hypothetical protein